MVFSNPILHDIIKAYLVYDKDAIFSFCSTLPQTKRSKIYGETSPHKLVDSREEWYAGGLNYPADAVWRFEANGFRFPSYYIIHEIKTGKYNLSNEMLKHYINHNHVSLYIWAYKEEHKKNKKVPYAFVKMLDIESLKKYIANHTIQLMNDWVDNK